MLLKKSFLLLHSLILTTIFADEICQTTSNELLKHLLAGHPSIKMSQEIVKGAQERIDSAYWGFFPTPSVDISAKDKDQYTTVARLDQPIWTGGKLTSRYDMATSKEQENIYELQETSYQLIENFLSVLESYFQAKTNILELKEGLKNLHELDEMLSRRMEAGISSASDKELLKARIEQINSDMVLAQNRYKVSVLQIELMLDAHLDCSIDLNKIMILHSNEIEPSIKRLLEFHPLLKKIQAQIQTAKHEIEGTKASVMPNLSLRLEHRRGDLYNDTYNNDNNQNLIYVALSATTNAGLSILSDVKAAQIKVSELNFKNETAKKELIDTLLNDYNNYEITKSRIKILQNSIESAQNVLDSYKRLFVAGKRQWLNLVDASKELMQYKIQLANIEVSRQILAYRLALKNGQINLQNGDIL